MTGAENNARGSPYQARLQPPCSFLVADFVTVILLALTMILQGCGSEPPRSEPRERADSVAENPPSPRHVPRSPHVIFISMDTTRPDYLGLYGHPWVETPNLDRLAEESIVFDNCYTPAPTTLAAHTSMFTGTHPHTHGVARNGFIVNESNEMLAEVLQEAGYHTVAVIGAFPLHSRFNIHQGFDVYDDPPRNLGALRKSETSRIAKEVTDRVLALIDSLDENKPLFVFAHYFDAHTPYYPPAEYVARYDKIPDEEGDAKIRKLIHRAYSLLPGGGSGGLARLVQRYAAEITYVDAQIGRLVKGLKQREILDNAILVVTSDHGETLWDHEPFFGHGRTLYDATTRAVGIVRLPSGRGGGARITIPVSTIDWMPSILSFLELSVPLAVEGVVIDFNSPLVGDPNRPVFSEATKPHKDVETDARWFNLLKARSIRTQQFTLIHIPYQNRTELYDRTLDPGENENLLDSPTQQHIDKAEELSKILESWAVSGQPKPSHFEPRNVRETEQRLRALGYLN